MQETRIWVYLLLTPLRAFCSDTQRLLLGYVEGQPSHRHPFR